MSFALKLGLVCIVILIIVVALTFVYAVGEQNDRYDGCSCDDCDED